MNIEIGQIKAIFRYPVKSMAGEQLDTVSLGWHGLDGDRRFAFRRIADQGGFPWMTASRMPELILFKPLCRDLGSGNQAPTHVRTPEGKTLLLRGAELRAEIARRHGAEVELMQLNQGVFDEASVSLITLATCLHIERESGLNLDIRRFRPNIFIETYGNEPFEEDHWVGKVMSFGESAEGAAVSVTLRDKRCVMINLDPETAQADPSVLKSVVRLNQNNAGVYGAVVRTGDLSIGQKIYLKSI
jgi:MOSC domain-containing protein